MLEDHERNHAKADGDQTDEAQLSVGQLGETLERLAPDTRRQKGQESLKNQQQCERDPQRFPHVGLALRNRLLRGRLRTTPRPVLLEVLEELGARIEDQHVALAAERRLVCFETAVERVELGVLTVGAGVNYGRARVAPALDLLRTAIGVGENDLTLAVALGWDFSA